jgi:hypothetical protein
MSSLQNRPTTFNMSRADLNCWPWAAPAAVAIMITIALLPFGPRTLQGPVVGTTAGQPAASAPDSYVDLRHRVEARIPALRMTSDPAEILGREAAIGAAMRAARPHARQGDLFTPAVTENVRAVLTAGLTRRSAVDRASLMNDVPALAARINEPYPTGEALASFPALLLQVLPRLPEDLEYRLMGRDLIIRDAHTNLIVDYLPDVMPMVTDVTP